MEYSQNGYSSVEKQEKSRKSSFLNFSCFSALQWPFCALSILFFSLIFRTGVRKTAHFPHMCGKRKIKKSILLYSFIKFAVKKGFSTINFPFSRSHLVCKIEKLVTDLPPRLCLGCKIVTRFSFFKLETPEKRKIIVSKRFFHTKFDKFI